MLAAGRFLRIEPLHLSSWRNANFQIFSDPVGIGRGAATEFV